MDTAMRTHGGSQLARAAEAVPPAVGRLLSVGGRVGGSALALAVAVDQSYARTRALALAIAVLAALTLVVSVSRFAGRAAWLGAAVLFFGGALVAHLPPGKLMILAGALAAVGAGVDDQHARRAAGVTWFFTGLGVVVALVIAIFLGIEQ